jgi:uncharacterized short protein YbdD (DUF466 family)
MICTLCDLGSEARRLGHLVSQAASLMVGVPDYETFVAHRQRMHPDEPVPSREAFFRERQESRYGGKGRVFRCC